MIRSPLIVWIVTLTLMALSAGAQQAPRSAELIQYVRDAVKAGLKDAQIQQNAARAGWAPSDIDAAMAYVRAGNQPDAADPHPAKPESPDPSASSAVAAAKPASTPAATPNAAFEMTGTKTPPSLLPAPETPPPAKPDVPDDYRIGAGDTLQISVWKEPEASVGHVVVRPDGKISVPLIKDVAVIGLRPAEVERIVTQELAKFINTPDVTVVVTGINSKKIYVVGAVRKEGPIAFTYRMTVMQALSEAGGLNDYAKKRKIYVLRNEDGREFRFPFDYDMVLKGERMEMNIPLVPGDTVVVPH